MTRTHTHNSTYMHMRTSSPKGQPSSTARSIEQKKTVITTGYDTYLFCVSVCVCVCVVFVFVFCLTPHLLQQLLHLTRWNVSSIYIYIYTYQLPHRLRINHQVSQLQTTRTTLSCVLLLLRKFQSFELSACACCYLALPTACSNMPMFTASLYKAHAHCTKYAGYWEGEGPGAEVNINICMYIHAYVEADIMTHCLLSGVHANQFFLRPTWELVLEVPGIGLQFTGRSARHISDTRSEQKATGSEAGGHELLLHLSATRISLRLSESSPHPPPPSPQPKLHAFWWPDSPGAFVGTLRVACGFVSGWTPK